MSIDDCYRKFVELYDYGCKQFIKTVDLSVLSRWPGWNCALKRVILEKKKLWYQLKNNRFSSDVLKMRYKNKSAEVDCLTKKCTFEFERKLAIHAKVNPIIIKDGSKVVLVR